MLIKALQIVGWIPAGLGRIASRHEHREGVHNQHQWTCLPSFWEPHILAAHN